jgi:hypothetical protein
MADFSTSSTSTGPPIEDQAVARRVPLDVLADLQPTRARITLAPDAHFLIRLSRRSHIARPSGPSNDEPGWTSATWRSEERWRARGLLAVIVALHLAAVYVLVLLNAWNKAFYDALQAWGTVPEDYSAGGDAWRFFPSRRWSTSGATADRRVSAPGRGGRAPALTRAARGTAWRRPWRAG